jgi:hypothetical protein
MPCLILQKCVVRHCACLLQVMIGAFVVVVVLRADKAVVDINNKIVRRGVKKYMVKKSSF